MSNTSVSETREDHEWCTIQNSSTIFDDDDTEDELFFFDEALFLVFFTLLPLPLFCVGGDGVAGDDDSLNGETGELLLSNDGLGVVDDGDENG